METKKKHELSLAKRMAISLVCGLVAGLAAAGAALGVAELVAAPFSSVSSPVVAVGNVVVDNVPNAVKEFAIATFGQNDKIALIFGTTIFLFIFGAVLGMLTTKRRIAAPVGAGVFALVGAVSALSRTAQGRSPFSPASWAVSPPQRCWICCCGHHSGRRGFPIPPTVVDFWSAPPSSSQVRRRPAGSGRPFPDCSRCRPIGERSFCPSRRRPQRLFLLA